MSSFKNKKHHQVSTRLMSTVDQQTLPIKLQNLFDQQVINLYEDGKFSKAIKEANRILDSFPKNGETLAMKGLCLHSMNHSKGLPKTEGMALITEGLRYNLKSSICWRVKGVAHKMEEEFESAIACFKQARNYDSNNIRVVIDLAQLHLELRQFSEFEKSRHHLWTVSRERRNAIAYMIALYLNGKYAECLEFLDRFLDEYQETVAIFDEQEISEIFLFKCKLLNKLKRKQECLHFINQKLELNEILDEIQAYNIKFEIEKELNQTSNAKESIIHLIHLQSENKEYQNKYLALMKFHDTNDDQIKDEISSFFVNLQVKFPKNNSIQKILFEICSNDDEFRQMIDKYLCKNLCKSVSSLFNNIGYLYVQYPNKGIIIDELMNEYVHQLSNHHRFHSIDDERSAPPSCLLWTNYYIACRLFHENSFSKALAIINASIKYMPTCVELYVLKARIFKYSGNRRKAYEYLYNAQMMDKADRYLNTKCCRYAFRIGLIDDAIENVLLFLKKSDGLKSFETLEVMWYELHLARAHQSKEEIAPALRQYSNIFNQFIKFWKYQSDFHRYAYRKISLSSYLQLLEWEDELYNHPFFIQGAHHAIPLWLQVYRLQTDTNLTDDELELILVHGCHTNKSEIVVNGEMKNSSENKDANEDNNIIIDPKGFQMIHEKKPLKEAAKWMKCLLKCCHSQIETHLLNIEVCVLSAQYLEMQESIAICRAMDAHNPTLMYLMIIVLTVISNVKNVKTEELRMTIKANICQDFRITLDEHGCISLNTFASDFLDIESMPNLIAMMEIIVFLCPASMTVTVEELFQSIVSAINSLSCTVLQSQTILRIINKAITKNSVNQEMIKILNDSKIKLEHHFQIQYPLIDCTHFKY